MSVNIENERTVVKIRISSYFAQRTPMVSDFQKQHPKFQQSFIFFKIEKSLENAIFAFDRRHFGAENHTFSLCSLGLTRKDPTTCMIYIKEHLSSSLKIFIILRNLEIKTNFSSLDVPNLESINGLSNFSYFSNTYISTVT